MNEPSRTTRRRSSYIPFALAILSAGIAIIVAFWGSFSLRVFGLRLSSHGALRPALFAGLFLAIAYRWRPRWPKGTVSTYAASLLRGLTLGIAPAAAALILALCWMYGTRAAGASDTFGYVSQARLWLLGDLHVHQNFAASVPWPNADWTFTPLGYRPAANHTIVPTYAPGLPLLMAMFMSVLGTCGAFVVTPLAAALLVVSTYALGVQVSGRATGALAALLTVSSPTILFMTLWPMSDVPAAAFWVLSLVLAWRSPPVVSATLSAISAGIAILIRPNLAPLIVFPASLIAWGVAAPREVRVRRLVTFAVTCLPFVVLVAAINHNLYGSFLVSGYGEVSSIYRWQNLRPNLERYPRWLWETQGAYVFVFLVGVALAPGPKPESRRLRWILLAYIAAVFGCYLFYIPFDDWWYLRFVIPALPAMFVLSIDAIRRCTLRFGPAVQAMVAIVFTAASVSYAIHYARANQILEIGEGEQKYVDVGRYLAHELPPDTVVISGLHSGNIRLYSHMRTLRVDLLDRAWLDRAIEYLRSTGPSPYLVLEESEVRNFRQRFANQQMVALVDRPAVAIHSRQVYVFSSDLQRAAESPRTIPLTKGCE